jgi:hypothetical protein
VTRSLLRILGPSSAMLIAALLLAVTLTDGREDGAFAGGQINCNNPQDAQFAEGYSYDNWGTVGHVSGAYIFSADISNTGDQPLEIVFGGASPELGTLVGFGTIPMGETSTFDLDWTVPNFPPGTYDMWMCWYNPELGNYFFDAMDPFTVLGAPECGTYGSGPQFATPEEAYNNPLTPYPGETIHFDIYNAPEGVVPADPTRVEFLLDPAFPALGTHLGMGDNLSFTGFNNVGSYGVLPDSTAPGMHTLALCWWDPGAETWYYNTLQIEVLTQGAPRLDCYDSFFFPDTTAVTQIAPPSGFPLTLLDIDWTSEQAPFEVQEDLDWWVDVLWDWVDTPGQSRPGAPAPDMLIGEGTYHTLGLGGHFGEAEGIVPADATDGDHVITLCIDADWNDGG